MCEIQVVLSQEEENLNDDGAACLLNSQIPSFACRMTVTIYTLNGNAGLDQG